MIPLALYLLLGAGLAAYTWWIYTRVELPVRQARALAALRTTALLLVLALLFDPPAPWRGAGAAGDRWVVVDASLSMGAAPREGSSAWEVARDRAEELQAEGWRIRVMGGDDPGALPAAAVAARSLLAPALERALEGGASEILVLSDLRVEDRVEVAATRAGARVPIRLEPLGGAVRNVGVARFEMPDAPRRGEGVEASVELFAEEAGDSARLDVFEEDRLVASATVALPAPGLRGRVTVPVPPAQAEGIVRYTARVRPADGDTLSDAAPHDDARVAYAAAGYDEGALVLVSLRPDWEPRYLLPVLAEATGLTPRGYLRVGPDRFLPMGRAEGRGFPVDSQTVGRAARAAALLVVHGVSGGGDGWTRTLVSAAPRVLVWPEDAGAATAIGVPTTPPRAGEWYAERDAPPSPVAGELAGTDVQGLPPLSGLMVLSGEASATVVLRAQLGGTGPGEPALVLVRGGGRRVAAPLARGFWRWAVRDGAGRDTYRRLWAGVAGWLLASDAAGSVGQVRPLERVVPRASAVRWALPGPGRVSLRLTHPDGSESGIDTTVAAGGTLATGALPPGRYTFEARDSAGSVVGSGRFDVASATDELAVLPLEPDSVGGVSQGGGSSSADAGRPLRTSPWPYILVLLLLCAEWIGRRRAGLR